MHDPVTVVADADLSTEPLPGTLLEWGWTDRKRGLWSALVRVRTPQHLRFERWIDGRDLRHQSTAQSQTSCATSESIDANSARRSCAAGSWVVEVHRWGTIRDGTQRHLL